MSATSLYFSEGARIDHSIRVKGFFTLASLDGTKLVVYGMGKPVPTDLCKELNRSSRGAALTQFLSNQVKTK